MKPLPARVRWLAAAWLTLALGVSGWWFTERAGPPAAAGPVEPRLVTKSKVRELQTKRHSAGRDGIRELQAKAPSPERDRDLVHAVSQWAGEAPDEAVAWLAEVPSGELRDWLACALVTAFGESDPERAAGLIDAELPAGLPRNHAIVALAQRWAQRWAQRSPEDARQWLSKIPCHDEALREVEVIEASRIDPRAAVGR
jgi:hypothetical protein